MLIKIKDKCYKFYNSYLKGNIQNIVLVVCISGFIFGFFMGYLITQSDKMEMAQLEETTSKNQVLSKQEEVLTDEERTIKISKEVSPAIVVVKNKIYVDKGEEKVLVDRGIGSGVIYTGDGYIMTNHHVVKGASQISVVISSGEEIQAQLIGQDEKTDLAVIKIKEKNLTHAELGDSNNLKVGERVVAIGSPLGEEFSGTVTSGIISSTERNLNLGNRNAKLIQTDTAINPGNSGGALINKDGKVIGINSLKISSGQVEGMGFAIPINTALPIINELIENGYVKRAWLGLGLGDSELPRGICIGGIMKGGPADKGQIQEGDIIVRVDNNRVKNIAELSSLVDEYLPNDVVELTLIRNNKEIKTKITLAETPKSSTF